MAIMTVLDLEHAKNHAGRVFTAGVIASGATVASMMITPASGTDVHAVFSAYSSAAMTMRLYESVPNSASSGSAFTPVCRNRCTPEKRTSSTAIRTGVTLNSSGATALTPLIPVGAGTGPQAVGGQATSRQEWILDGAKKYHINLTGSGVKYLEVDYYEVPSVH